MYMHAHMQTYCCLCVRVCVCVLLGLGEFCCGCACDSLRCGHNIYNNGHCEMQLIDIRTRNWPFLFTRDSLWGEKSAARLWALT